VEQGIPGWEFEVIVVNDDSSDNTRELKEKSYPYTFRMLGEEKICTTAARNLEARNSSGQALVLR
jgi:glycosyltransferase involved in cell wall biosynthesis